MKKLALLLVYTLIVGSFSMYGVDLGVYGASDNSINKIPAVITDYVFDLTTAPTLRIEENHEGEYGATTQTFVLQLDNAEWIDNAPELVADYIVDNNNFDAIDNGEDFTVETTRLSDTKLEISFYINGDDSEEFYFKVPLLAEMVDEGNAKVSIDGRDSALSSGTYTFAIASNGRTMSVIEDTTDFVDNVVIDDVFIDELVIGTFNNNSEINLKLLNDGFDWVDNGNAKVVGSGGFDFTYSLQASDYNDNIISFIVEDFNISSSDDPDVRGSIIIEGLEIDDSIDSLIGNVEMKIYGDDVTTETFVVADYVDYSVSIDTDDSDDLITHYQGTQGVNIELPTIIIKEDVPESWLINRSTEINLPTWIKIKNITIEDETKNIVNSSGNRVTSSDLYWEIGDSYFEIDGLERETDDIVEMHITLTVDIDADAPLSEIDAFIDGKHAMVDDYIIRMGQVVNNDWGEDDVRYSTNSVLNDEVVIPGFSFISEHDDFLPSLKIVEKEVNGLGDVDQTFRITLNNAIWNENAVEEIEKYQESYLDSFNVECTKLSDNLMEIIIQSDTTIDEVKWLRIPLFVTVEDKGYATISVDGLDSGVSSDILTFAKVVDRSFEYKTKISEFAYGETGDIDDFEIFEIAPLSLPTSKSVVSFKLNDGFIWTSGGIISPYFDRTEYEDEEIEIKIDGATLTAEIDFSKATNRYCYGGIYVFFQEFIAVTDSPGDVILTIDGANIKSEKIKIGEFRGNQDSWTHNTISKSLNVLPETKITENVPYLKIKESENGNFGVGIQDVDLILNNAKWNEDILNLLSESVLASHDDFEFEFTEVNETTINVKITPIVSESELRWFSIPLFTVVDEVGNVTVEVNELSGRITEGTYLFANITEPVVEAHVEEIVSFYKGNQTDIKDIYFEEVVSGSIPFGGDSYTLTLKDGFEWVEPGSVVFLDASYATAETEMQGENLVINIDYKKEPNGLRQAFTLSGVKIKSLDSSSYGDVKVVVDSENNEFEDALIIAECIEKINNGGGTSSGGGGGGGGGAPAQKTQDEKVQVELKKRKNKTVLLVIDDPEIPEASISEKTFAMLIEDEKPLIINNSKMTLKLTTKDLKSIKGESSAELKVLANQLDEEKSNEIYLKLKLKENTKITPLLERIFEVSASMSDNKEGDEPVKLKAPVAMTIDLSDKELTEEDIRKLSGVRYETNENGELIMVKCGGTYNKETGEFTFYTDSFGKCGVIKDEGLKKLSLYIDDTYTLVNDENKQMDTPPEIYNNRTVVPLRYIAEALGAEVSWEAETQTITMTKDGKILTLKIGEITDGIDAPPMIKNSRTLVPVRYISEAFGANVMWFEESKKIEIIQ